MDSKLKQQLEDLNITTCEVRLASCSNFMYLTPMHRHKRVEYKNCPDMLWDINQVVLACQNCHHRTEPNRELTESIFMKLRGPDEMLSEDL